MKHRFRFNRETLQSLLDFARGRAAAPEEQEPAPETVEAEVPAPETERLPERRSGDLLIAARTNIGKVRTTNQDAVIEGDGLAGIADGMGGHNGGETASAGCRDGLLRQLKDRQPNAEILRAAVENVNKELYLRSRQEEGLSGMGTTLTALWAAPEEMLIAQVGDSRAYRLRDGRLEQITRDHSMVAEMLRCGLITEAQAENHPMRNVITRAVGTEDDIEVDIHQEKREAGDRWLLCSDGLHGMVAQDEMERLAQLPDLEEAADKLIDAALDAGGQDNVSLVLVQDGIRREEAAS